MGGADRRIIAAAGDAVVVDQHSPVGKSRERAIFPKRVLRNMKHRRAQNHSRIAPVASASSRSATRCMAVRRAQYYSEGAALNPPATPRWDLHGSPSAPAKNTPAAQSQLIPPRR